MTKARANPYYEEYAEIAAAHPGPKERASYDKRSEWHSLMRAERDRLVGRYAWAIPTNRVIGRLAKMGPIVEMGAGTGYWAYLLSEAGADVVAYDIKPAGLGRNAYCNKIAWFDVKKGGPEELTQHGDRTLMLCWPPYETSLTSDSLMHYPGERLIYVGEAREGCTGDRKFFDLLETEWVQTGSAHIPQWPRIWDRVALYERRCP